jgi:hypothetical protein
MNKGTHIRVVGALFIFSNILPLLILIPVSIFAIVFGTTATLSSMPDWISNPEGMIGIPVMGFIFIFTFLIVLVCTVPGIVIGYGLLQRWPLARPFGIVLALFSILNFPIGTCISVYAIWALMGQDADEYFHPDRYLRW